jgi:hypothetical protein
MDRFKKKLKRSIYYLRYLLFGLQIWQHNNAVTFARGPQLRDRIISVISELYFVASGFVLSGLMVSTVQYWVYLCSLVYSF